MQQIRPDWQVDIYAPDAVQVAYDRFPPKLRAVRGMNPADYDLIVTQRVGKPGFLLLLQWCASHGVATVVDADDALWAIHRDNRAWHAWNGGENHYEYMDQAAQVVDLVTVTTEALAKRYAKQHGRVEVLPNRVPAAALTMDSIRSQYDPEPVLGWSGTVMTHPGDLDTIRPVISALNPQVRIVGDGAGVAEAWGLDPGRVDVMGPRPLSGYHQALTAIDVGLVPLLDSPFNKAKCVDAGTRISTRRGVIEAGEILVGDEVWRDGWRAVEAVEHDVAQPGFEVITDGGYTLRLTPEHRMLVNGEWAQAKHIAVGDVMAMDPEPVGPTVQVQVPWPADSRMNRRETVDYSAFLTAPDGPRVALSPRWGRFLGAFVGDGSCGQSTQLQISCDGQDQDWIELLIADFRAFGLTPRTEKIATYGGEVLRRRGVRVASAHLLRVLNSLGLTTDRPNGRPIRKVCVPEVIWRSPREVIAEFLAGYFEADGCTTSSGVSATSKDEQLIRDVQRLLILFGIVSRVGPRTHRAQNGFTGEYWHLTMGRAGADVFEKEIGFRSARKIARLAEITGRSHSNAYRPLNWSPQVTLVTPCMVVPVDIQVEGSEYMAAGFVSHNSSLKALEFSAMGVPVVAAGTPANRALAREVPISLASTLDEWSRAIADLSDPQIAAERGAAARVAVREKGWTIEGSAELWAAAWERAVARRKVMA